MVRAAYRPPGSTRLAHLLVQPVVRLGGDGPVKTAPPCELVLAGNLRTLARSLLACERRSRGSAFDGRACTRIPMRRYARRAAPVGDARPCRACVTSAELGAIVEPSAGIADKFLRATGPDGADWSGPPEDRWRCERVLVDHLDRLVGRLFDCEAESAVRTGVLEDAACESRAETAYARAVTSLAPPCRPATPPAVLGTLARVLIGAVFDRLFCLG